MTGKTIGQYHVLERVGDELSTVYKARDLKLDRLVILKAIDIPPDDTDAMTSFQKETRAGISLSHPNIAAIFDIIEADGGKFIIFEYIPGETLRERIERVAATGEQIPIDRCLDYILDAAGGLAEAHRKGIVHRDVSAANIIVTPTHAVKITNFGKARFGDGPTFSGSLPLSSAYGTLAPEQLKGEPVDHRGDIFSLTSLLFELVTGQKPFRAKGAAALLHEILYNTIPNMSDLRPGVSADLQKIVEKGTAKNPADRYATMEALIADLRKESRESLGEMETLPDEPAVAILPIVALGGNAELTAYADGLVEEIAFHLQPVAGLQVTSLTSSAQFKNKTEDVRKVAAFLNANLVVEGTARSAGTLARVILKLTDASTGYQLWTERFDRDLANALTAQEEIAQVVARVLQARVGGEEIVAAPIEPTNTGRFVAPVEAPPPPLRLEEILAAANGLSAPRDVMPDAIRAARAEIMMNPGAIKAHIALGYCLAVIEGTLEKAEASFKRALEIDPNSSEAHLGYATHVLAPLGSLDEAGQHIAKGDTSTLQTNLAAARLLLWKGQYQAAVDQCRKAFAIDSNSPEVYLLLGRAFAALEQYQPSIIAFGRGRVLAPEDPRLMAALAYAYGRSGQSVEANRLADEIGSLSKKSYVSVLDVALPYAGLGLSEWVSCCVERAREDKAAGMLWWNLDPEWASFR